MYRGPSLSTQTVLGIPEPWERVLTYALGWVSGLIFLLIEQRNSTVRRHAWQSVVIFGTISIVLFVLGVLSHIWVIGLLFGLLSGVVTFGAVLVWLGLMIAAYFSPVTFIKSNRIG
ncbi:MAG: DUF4870 domain-containing protein [Ktedonobacterales bacterium]